MSEAKHQSWMNSPSRETPKPIQNHSGRIGQGQQDQQDHRDGIADPAPEFPQSGMVEECMDPAPAIRLVPSTYIRSFLRPDGGLCIAPLDRQDPACESSARLPGRRRSPGRASVRRQEFRHGRIERVRHLHRQRMMGAGDHHEPRIRESADRRFLAREGRIVVLGRDHQHGAWDRRPTGPARSIRSTPSRSSDTPADRFGQSARRKFRASGPVRPGAGAAG